MAIFGGDRLRGTPVDKIGNFEEKKFLENIYYIALADAPGLPRVCNLHESSIATCFFCLAGLAGGSIIENLTQIFFSFQKNFFLLKHHVDL